MVLWPGGWVAHALGTGPVLVGRAEECDVHVDEASVSRRHVIIHPGMGSAPAEVEDLGSANGTRVGGRRLAAKERVVLVPGDLVEMGKAILVTLETPRSLPHGGAAQGDPESVTRLVDLVAASERREEILPLARMLLARASQGRLAAFTPAADVEDSERKRIEQALAAAQGNQTRAAELLGISRRTLVNRLDAFGMPRPRKNRVE